ncbi:MAG: lysylphosphatidylglycerol synthase domain-containing protein [Candidatus Daviesbacteria bacterium]|nr:lysylphosphatidylglycerol synthase domain-containing protein [Candidatus Daviesbacteria bacterium]
MNLKKVLSITAVGTILIFIFWNIIKNKELIIKFPWHPHVLDLFLMLLFLVPIYISGATSWYLITNALNFKINYFSNLKIWVFSNFSRFIPGSIWQYAGRVYLTSKYGISKTEATTALIIEAIFNLTAGLLVVFISVCFLGFSLGGNFNIIVFILVFFVTCLIFVLGNKRLMTLIVRILMKITKKSGNLDFTLPKKWIGILIFSYLLQFVLGGSVLFFLSRNAVDLSFDFYPIFIAIYAVSWMLGYISIFASSGLGIQELSLAGFLSLYMPFSIAVIIAVAFRVLLIVAELSTVVALSLITASPKPRAFSAGIKAK